MARQMGSRISFALKAESVYGTLPSGNWEKVPILSFDPGAASDLVDDPSIGFGHREKLDVFRGPISYKPKIEVPVDLRNIGYWMKALFGTYSVVGSGAPYTHTFKALNSPTVPSLGMEVDYPDANAGSGIFFDYAGSVVDTAAFDLAPTGPAKLSMGLISKSETKNSSTQAGTPTTQTYTSFSQLHGLMFIGTAGSTAPATPIGNILGATLSINNQVDAQPGVSTGGLILGADPGQLMVTGDITARFDSTALYDDAIAATFVALSFGYQIDSNNLLNFVMPRVALGRTSPGVSGPAGVDYKSSFQAARDSGSSASIIATLMNDVASY